MVNVVASRNRAIEALGIDRATNFLTLYNDRTLVKQLPNALSLSRFPLAALEHWHFAGKLHSSRPEFAQARRELRWILLIAAVTDVMDGQIAMRCGVSSQLGAMADPAGDKAIAVALYLDFVSVMRGRGYLSPKAIGQLERAIKIRLACDGGLVALAAIGGALGLKGRANHYGKVKFTLDVVGLLAAYEIFLAAGSKSQAKAIDGPEFKNAAELAALVLTLSAYAASGFAALSFIEHLRRPEQELGLRDVLAPLVT